MIRLEQWVLITVSKIVLIVLMSGFLLLACGKQNENSFNFDELETIEAQESEDLISAARESIDNKEFSEARAYLEMAENKGYSSQEVNEVNLYLEQEILSNKYQNQDAIIHREVTTNTDYASKDCDFLKSNFIAWSACTKNENNLKGLGESGLKAYYISTLKCDFLSGIDDSGMSYVCANASANSCSSLDASQTIIDACYRCDGSNKWLRVYATGTVLQCN